MLSNYICYVFRCLQCGVFLKHRKSLNYHLRNTSHVFGPGGRKYVTSSDVQTTADNSIDCHKSGSSRQSSKHTEQQPTSSSSIIASQQSAFNDYDSRRPSSSSVPTAYRHASPRVSSSTAKSSLAAVLEYTNRDNECVFYDYKAVSGEPPCTLTSKRPTFSSKRTSMCCRFAVGSPTPPPNCSRSDSPRFIGSTAMRSCCRRLCFQSSCSSNAATSCSSQK